VLSDLQAEFGTAIVAKESEKAKCSTAAFPKLFMFREIGTQVSLVPMSRPSLRTVAPAPCLSLDIKDWVKKDMRGFFDGRILMGNFD
jgi:hypothetical protein